MKIGKPEEIGHRAYCEIIIRADKNGNCVAQEIELAGLSQSVRRWMRGKAAPSLMSLYLMQDAGYDIEYILTGKRVS